MHTALFTRRDAVRFSMLLAASPAALAATPASAQLASLAEQYYHRLYTLFPLDATENAGDAAFESLLEIEIAPAHRKRQRELCNWLLASLKRIDTKGLDDEERTTWSLLEFDAKDRLALLEFPSHLLPFSQIDLFPVRMAQWAGGQGSQPLKTAANYRHFLARLKKVPAWVDQAIANLRQGMAAGITLPQPLVERALPQLDSLLPADTSKSPYLAGVNDMAESIPANERAQIARAYRAVVAKSVTPAVRKFRDFVAGTYMPAARNTSGLGGLPGGAEWYRALVRRYTTSDITPAQLHATGLREVERIRGEMEGVKARFGYDGALNDFLKTLDDRPELRPFKTEDEVLAAYKAINEKVKAGLPKLFARSPRAPIEIRTVEPARRDTASDYYVPPAADGSRPGVFFAVVQDPLKYRNTTMTSLFLHEGQPGHHFQMSFAQELPVPRFRKVMWFDAFGEGWALYAEGLGRDLGLYEDPNAYLGRLQMELHRALRLVVDTGLHDLGWSREKTIAFLMEKEGSKEDDARRATERYMAWPGQALAYKTGELKIIELREKARARLGSRFDIRDFHAQVLRGGCIPLSMLDARVQEWMAAA
jgi:uncharacterized protein (DUF885 family)